jgi:hypothetical protein
MDQICFPGYGLVNRRYVQKVSLELSVYFVVSSNKSSHTKRGLPCAPNVRKSCSLVKMSMPGSLPGEHRFRLDEHQPIPDVSSPVQNDKKHLVTEAESYSLLPESSKKDLVFLSDQCNLRDDGPSGPEDLEKKSEDGGE